MSRVLTDFLFSLAIKEKGGPPLPSPTRPSPTVPGSEGQGLGGRWSGPPPPSPPPDHHHPSKNNVDRVCVKASRRFHTNTAYAHFWACPIRTPICPALRSRTRLHCANRNSGRSTTPPIPEDRWTLAGLFRCKAVLRPSTCSSSRTSVLNDLHLARESMHRSDSAILTLLKELPQAWTLRPGERVFAPFGHFLLVNLFLGSGLVGHVLARLHPLCNRGQRAPCPGNPQRFVETLGMLSSSSFEP